jgi:O-antigen/teichoic acid export membrane protein
MFLAAPFLLHSLGTSQYGLWMLITAIVGSAGALSTGFGLAAVRYVSHYRGLNNWEKVSKSIRCSVTVNLFIGTLLALFMWIAAQVVVTHVFKVEPSLRSVATLAFRISAPIVLTRSVESVLASSLRAYEHYGPAVKISTASRLSLTVISVVLGLTGHTVVAIMLATVIVSSLSLIAHFWAARKLIGEVSFIPSFDRVLLKETWHFGSYSWLQALSGLAFNQGDRLIIGAALGTSQLAVYSICVQVAQPIHGLLAAGLNVLFPWVSARHSGEHGGRYGNVLRSVVLANIFGSAILVTALTVISKPLLEFWMGPGFASQGRAVLNVLAIGFGLIAINVAPHYILLAIGQVRYLTALNIAAGAISFLTMLMLVPTLGVMGAAIGRLVYGPMTWVMFARIRPLLSIEKEQRSAFLASDSNPA